MPRLTLQAAREHLEWSQSKLAAEAGEKVSAIYDIEAARSKHPSYVRVVRIFRALRCGGLPQRITIDHIFPVADPPACLKGRNGDRRRMSDRRSGERRDEAMAS